MEQDELHQRIVTGALSWIGTPYHDHAGLKGIGVDCAYFPLRIMQAVGIIPLDYEPPKYSPQEWLIKGESTRYLGELLKFAREIQESEVQPGDLVLYRLRQSWTHAAIVIEWPNYLLHPIKDRGVIGSRADEGFLKRWPRRFFSFVPQVKC